MAKTALILHGWPQFDVFDPLSSSYFIVRRLMEDGYAIKATNLFSEKIIFNEKSITETIKSSLNNKNPDLIVGISFGGVILPLVARNFPHAKLVFISSGIAFKPKTLLFNFLMRVTEYHWSEKLAEIVLSSPDFIIETFYKLLNPFRGTRNNRHNYEKDMKVNISYIRRISIKKNRELVKFAFESNNVDLLRNINNPALIFSGSKDLLMPSEAAVELNNLLSNSKLIRTEGEHYNSFTEKEYKIMKKFLEG